MQIPRTEGLIIQGNEVSVNTYFNKEQTKYGFVISRMEKGEDSPLIKSGLDYATLEEAMESGQDLVAKIREIDLEF